MVGETISHYRVLRAVGRGGMGEVYEAEDLRLGRHVAIKFLSSARPATPEARQRFEREARTASALNHPHICTIHEFGEHDGQRFIVMELLEGSPLRDHLNRQPLGLDRCLTLGIEVADALEAAHRAGVVHRDITPSNIFITADGHAKVLDFGLAKMHSGAADVLAMAAGDASTRTGAAPALTTPGAVMGTTAYMSPEQIAGEDLDSRTDVFSFGCVLYEMATGARPFVGKTTGLVFDAILHDTPVPATSRNPAVPVPLQQIIDRALEKDRDLRYQNGGEIHRDLQRLRRDLDTPQPNRTRPRRVVTAGPVVAVLAAGATLAMIAYLAAARRGSGVPSGTPRQITSSPGPETDPAISPDGNTIAFAAHEGAAPGDIWMVDVRGGPPQRVTTDPANDHYPAWFPDGRTFAFVSDRGGHDGIWRAPRFDGDAATLLIPDADQPAVSPNGREIAFVRGRGGYRRVAVAPVDDPGNVRFLTGDADGKWEHSRPAWSPDGQTICYDAWDGLWLVPAHGGKPQRLTTADARNDAEPAWSTDGRFVYFMSMRDRQAALYRIGRDGGTRQRVTLGSGTEATPRVSPDGRFIAFTTAATTLDLAIQDLSTGEVRQFGSSRDEMFPALAPGGRAVYFTSNRWGSFDIWAQGLSDGVPAGSARRVAEAEGIESHLACSPDGRWIAYYRILNGRRDVFVVPSGGGTPTRITDDPSGALDPAWSPDGKRLAFSSERDGAVHIWIQEMDSGKPVGAARRVTSGAGIHRGASWSPDGSKIAYVTFLESNRSEVAIVPADGKGPSSIVTSGAGAQFVRWTAAGLFVTGTWGRSQFQLRSVKTDVVGQAGLPAAPVDLASPVAQFDIESTGRFVVFLKGVLEGDIWVLDASSQRF